MRIHRNLKKYRLWLILGPVLVALSLALGWSSASAQEEGVPQLTVAAERLEIRSGPDPSYPPFETLVQGTTMGIIGYNAETGWWQIVSTFGSPGWVSGDEADVAVNEAAMRQFVSPPAPAASTETVSTTETAGTGRLVFQTANNGPIYIINEDGTGLRYLTTGMYPVLSPDGQWVAFTRWETSQDGALGSVWVINIDGSGERVVHENVYNPRMPVWSADGTRLIIAMQQGGRVGETHKCWGARPPREATEVTTDPDPDDPRDVEFCFTLPPDPYWKLRLVEVAGGAHEDLPGDTYSLSPAWNPANNQHVVYVGNRALVNLNLTTEETWPLLEEPDAYAPVFSKDGSQIAFTYWQNDHWDIQAMNTDGSNRLRLTETPYQVFIQQMLNGEELHSYNNISPAWSPDGTQIAFLTDRTGSWEIWVMNADGSNQHPLFPAETLAGITFHYENMEERMLSWQ